MKHALFAACTFALIAPALAHDDRAMASDIKAFHGQLSPLWHGATGKARAEKACGQADALLKSAKDITAKPAGELVKSLEAFKTTCQTQPADADAAFGKVHDAFHHLIGH